MPHKKNPILSENITGLSRVIRSSCIPFMENISLWHERDISHSSVERTLGVDTLVLTDFAINRMKNIIKDLVVDKKMMQENLQKTNGLFNSQKVMLEIVNKNISREEAYKIVQNVALEAWNKNTDFKLLLQNDKKVKSLLSNNEINKIFDLNYFLKNIDVIYKRVLK